MTMVQHQNRSSCAAKPATGRKQGWIRLKFLLIIPFCLEIGLAVGLSAYWSIQNSRQAMDRVVDHLENQTVETVNLRLLQELRQPQQINAINAQLLARNVIDSNDLEAITKQLWQSMRIYSGVTYINFANPGGLFVGVERLDNGDLVSEIIDPKRHPGKIYRHLLDDRGRPKKRLDIYDYEPRTDDWYTAGTKAQRPTWSSIYTWETGEPTKRLAVSASYPIYSEANQALKGVIGIDFLFDNLQKQLQTLNITPGTQIYLLENDGKMIASSTSESFSQDSTGAIQRTSLQNTQDPVLKSLNNLLRFQGGTVLNNAELERDLNGQPYFIRALSWNGLEGLDWRIVLAIPRHDLMREVDSSTESTIGICALALAGSVILGIITTRAISRPVQQLAEAAERFAIDQKQTLPPRSPIIELSALSRSFDHMGTQLKASFDDLEAANHHLEVTNLDLEYRVEERTRELSEALANLKQTQAQLIQTEKMSSLGQMLAGIAHEINNPTSFVYGNLDYIQEYMTGLLTLLDLYQTTYPNPSPEILDFQEELSLDFLIDDLPKVVGSMREGAERIRNIVQDLRNFSRMDGLDLRQVDLHEAIASTLMILGHRLKGNGSQPAINVVKQYGETHLVDCYPGLMSQVFVNLLVNAVDALEEAALQGRCPSPEITISTELRSSDNHFVVRIRDNGSGIPDHVRQRMFDPFFTTKPVGKGTGLGLAISYQIVADKHGGQLLCTTDERWGTEFMIAIPSRHSAALNLNSPQQPLVTVAA